ncbi:MAG: arylesterase [Xanthomonadales bacterium]|nr:arylesterase [Gammaproteobacteria bacterium]MBT8051000.1 arylesterase [Gammaproteobacteria bacterium]MBT8056591.1 arylesterase [Gammaproteobacteria bacterium]NNJ79191.1 arylesterase [Xanthomonadales bacterium]NNL04547.1 arylesterase [Xanthomonadales bacterium]
MRFVFARLLVVLTVLPLLAQASEERAIVILGDSLSAAYGMEVQESWPSLLQQRLEEDGYAYRVFNSSIAGDTTQGGLARLPRLLERQQPAIVIIELGGNDGLRGLPIGVTRANLSQMIDLSREAGADVILSEIRIPPNYGPAYTERFTAVFHELAGQEGVALLPFLLEDIALEPGMMLPDGIHPTAEAQPVILDEVWAVLEPVLR